MVEQEPRADRIVVADDRPGGEGRQARRHGQGDVERLAGHAWRQEQREGEAQRRPGGGPRHLATGHGLLGQPQ